MIPIDDPTKLPMIVRAVRESRGHSRYQVIQRAKDRFRTSHSVSNHWYNWEKGLKSPMLISLGPYLDAHRVRLALDTDLADDGSPWCLAVDQGKHRCAVAAGHGGSHRDYAGKEF